MSRTSISAFRTYTIVEDVALTDDQIAGYAADSVALAEADRPRRDVQREGLIAVEAQVKILRGREGAELLCVPLELRDRRGVRCVVRAMENACADWAAVCDVRSSTSGE